MMKFVIVNILFIKIAFALAVHDDSFNEEVFIKPLATGLIYSHFQFTTKWDIDTNNKNAYKHFRLFPKSLGEIISKYSVQELHLSLTQGLWKHQKWGHAIHNAPPGVQLWVWFKEGTRNIDSVWKGLTNALSGQFCASLNFIDETNTVNSKWSFRPTGVYQGNVNNAYLKYAALPRENVCTENLTPWKKLLPCGPAEGLATLLNAGQLFNSHYNSLSVRIRPVCRDVKCLNSSLELSQSVAAVLQPSQFKNRRQSWSFFRMFGSKLSSSCSLAQTSRIMIDTSFNKTGAMFHLKPTPSEFINANNKNVAVYNIKEYFKNKDVLNIEANYEQDIPNVISPSPKLFSHRFIAGAAQENGEIRTVIHNKEAKSVSIIYQEVIPWYIRIYLSKLKIHSLLTDAKQVKKILLTPTERHYKPSKDRQFPAHLEMIVELPANSVTEISIEFTRGFLKWTEHPPDANHGFYINSAVISALLHSPSNFTSIPISSSSLYQGFQEPMDNFFLRLYTETLLVSLPTPDFSMPYNVICLACTVVALAFGPLHNITTRRLTAVDVDEKKGLLQKIKSFVTKKRGGAKDEKQD